METFNQNSPMELNSNSIYHLAETRKWTMFLSILGFIFLGLCLIIIPVTLISATAYSLGIPEIVTVIPLILISIIYFFPIYYLLQFSLNSKKAIVSSDSRFLEISFRFLKLHYRFMGILIIIMLSLYATFGLIFLFSSRI